MSTPPDLPGYSFLDHLGSGGFADVFLYEQQWPRQQVAVKAVRPDVELSEDETELFRREADAMAGLADHPSIVSVVTAGVIDERPYLVMRYCPPPDLGERVRSEPLSVADALSTGVKLASAVETAHRSGILHRDIKPSNVLVTTYGEPALSDFGIAGPVQDPAPAQDVRVSYPWAPPELLEGTSTGSAGSDVYSLGATVWTLLMGRSPYAVPGGDNSPRALTARILHTNPPATGRPDVPGALDRLLQQCLAKDPGHRPQSALELARSLQTVEAAAGEAPTRITVAEQSSAPSGDASRDEREDVTRVRPTTVPAQQDRPAPGASGSGGPVQGLREAEQESSAPARSTRAGVAWVALAVLVLALGGFWLFGGESEQQPTDAAASPTGSPLDVAPDAPLAPQPPVVTARRQDEKVTFRWRTEDRSQAGDSWEWQDPQSGQSRRTTDTRRVLRGSGRLCLQVRLIRGEQASPWTRECSS